MISGSQHFGPWTFLVDVGIFIMIKLCFTCFFHLCIRIQHCLVAGAIGVYAGSIYIIVFRCRCLSVPGEERRL